MTLYAIEWTGEDGRHRRVFKTKEGALAWATKRYGGTYTPISIHTYDNAPDDLFDRDDLPALIWSRQNAASQGEELIF